MKISRRELRRIILKEIRNISEAAADAPGITFGSDWYLQNKELYHEVQSVGFEELAKAGRVDSDLDTPDDVIIAEAPRGSIRVSMRSIQGVIPDSKTISLRVSGRQFIVGMLNDIVNQ